MIKWVPPFWGSAAVGLATTIVATIVVGEFIDHLIHSSVDIFAWFVLVFGIASLGVHATLWSENRIEEWNRDQRQKRIGRTK